MELHYGKIKDHRIICEEYLGDAITDYKFFCFNGEPKFFYLSSDLYHDRQASMGYFDMDCNKLPLIRPEYKDIEVCEKPAYYNEMVKIAKILSADFPFVRVDFFALPDRFYFAELTFTPAAGMSYINPHSFDIEWGKMLKLPIQIANPSV